MTTDPGLPNLPEDAGYGSAANTWRLIAGATF